MLTHTGSVISQRYWLNNLKDEAVRYLKSLQLSDQPYRFYPCLEGQTAQGSEISLGFSCFALKIYYTLGLWEELTQRTQSQWIESIQSFQWDGILKESPELMHPFVDPVLIRDITKRKEPLRHKFPRVLRGRPSYLAQVLSAETKQVVATLNQVNAEPKRFIRGFSSNPQDLKRFLARFDWRAPWAAGGQVAAWAVFWATQAKNFLTVYERGQLRDEAAAFLELMHDQVTGGYFKGTQPHRGELLNGAMKILNALDWLEIPIHSPQQLANTCIRDLPSDEGCHLVDAIYILHRVYRETGYRPSGIETYSKSVLEMIRAHQREDGGFSYYTQRAQTTYYSADISRGLEVSDIHGTCLLLWAIAMLTDLLDGENLNWRVIRP